MAIYTKNGLKIRLDPDRLEKVLSPAKREIMNRGHKKGNEILSEYDFSKGIRGKYATAYHQESNVIVLDPDVAARYPNSEAVNQALRTITAITIRSTGRRPHTSRRR